MHISDTCSESPTDTLAAVNTGHTMGQLTCELLLGDWYFLKGDHWNSCIWELCQVRTSYICGHGVTHTYAQHTDYYLQYGAWREVALQQTATPLLHGETNMQDTVPPSIPSSLFWVPTRWAPRRDKSGQFSPQAAASSTSLTHCALRHRIRSQLWAQEQTEQLGDRKCHSLKPSVLFTDFILHFIFQEGTKWCQNWS